MTAVLFPVGRMIGGSVYKPFPVLDNFKKPKLAADGTPRTEFNLGVAIPKAGEQHWSQTAWGKQVLAVGAAAHPQQYQLPSYAWKIVDGDSTVPNKAGRRPCDQEGNPGHWVVWFKQTWAPKLVTDKGQVQLIEPDQIVPGYYIEVFADVVGNGNSPTPGVYLNPQAVNRVAFGERLSTASVDTTAVGFGAGPLPAGASTAPVGGGFNPAPATPAIVPNPAFLAPPAPPAPPAVVAPPVVTPPPAAHQMTAKAGGATYEQMIAAGWTDALLTQHGYM